MNIIKLVIKMYMTLLTPIIAGIINSIFCSKTKVLKSLKRPIDMNKNFIDGKRIFGDNKTWKGLFGYIFFNVVICIILGIVFDILGINNMNFFYINHANTIEYNMLIGFLIGLFYALFELPNSFLKRRLDITPGKTITGIKKIFFIILDQADSVFGVALIVWLFYPLGIKKYIFYIFIGTLTHLIINMLLYFAHIRKNMF